jgi:hypothetical protein
VNPEPVQLRTPSPTEVLCMAACQRRTSCLRSLGAIMFEMMIGYPPFYSDDPLTTCRKIVNWRMFLKFPDEIQVWTIAELCFFVIGLFHCVVLILFSAGPFFRTFRKADVLAGLEKDV